MPSPLTSWTWDPAQLLLIAAAAFLYYRRARTLAARGTPVPAWRRLVFALGLLLAFLAVASPIHELGEKEFFFVHMLQHILLGDLAPLCMVAGLTGPILRPVLAIPLFQRLRFLAHPLVAFPIWAVNLVLWHLPFAYQGALHHDAVHAVQHILLLHLRLPDVGAGGRGAAGARVVRHRDEARLHRRCADRRDDPRQRLRLVGRGLLPLLRAPGGALGDLRARRPGDRRAG